MDSFRRALDVIMLLINSVAQYEGVLKTCCCSVLNPGRTASALVTVYGGHLRGQAFLKHSSCGLVESLTTQMTTDEIVDKR